MGLAEVSSNEFRNMVSQLSAAVERRDIQSIKGLMPLVADEAKACPRGILNDIDFTTSNTAMIKAFSLLTSGEKSEADKARETYNRFVRGYLGTDEDY